jgi:hypothetical protein
MPLTRPFAFNIGSPLPGTSQVGYIAAGGTATGYNAGYGGVRWFDGPDESVGYILAYPVLSGNQPNPDNTSCSLGFIGTQGFIVNSFVQCANTLATESGDGPFSSGPDAYNWCMANSVWTTYSPDGPYKYSRSANILGPNNQGAIQPPNQYGNWSDLGEFLICDFDSNSNDITDILGGLIAGDTVTIQQITGNGYTDPTDFVKIELLSTGAQLAPSGSQVYGTYKWSTGTYSILSSSGSAQANALYYVKIN